jgi:hypothetical protein
MILKIDVSVQLLISLQQIFILKNPKNRKEVCDAKKDT